LPFLEQQGLYDKWNRNAAMANVMTGNDGCCPPTASTGTLAGDAVASGNATIAATPVRVFLCPADNGDPFLEAGSQYYSIATGTSLRGAKTNYDFVAKAEYVCNEWRRDAPGVRRMFGENSDTRIAQVTDGTSNTIMIAESTLQVYNGRCNPWAYRGWVQVGVDPGVRAINSWDYPTSPPPPPVYGRLGSWAWMGSLHPAGA